MIALVSDLRLFVVVLHICGHQRIVQCVLHIPLVNATKRKGQKDHQKIIRKYKQSLCQLINFPNCRERDRAQTDKKSNEKPNFLIRNKLIQITQGGTFHLPTGTGYLESWVYHVVQSVINVNEGVTEQIQNRKECHSWSVVLVDAQLSLMPKEPLITKVRMRAEVRSARVMIQLPV